MYCRLLGTKPIRETLLTYYQLDPKEHVNENLFNIQKYHSRKSIRKYRP